MIDVKEHVYNDDPRIGPPDVRTELKNVNYFFLGNGRIQIAIQSASAGDGTPVGVLIMNPERLRKKRDALTMDDKTGLGQTMIRIEADGRVWKPEPGRAKASWEEDSSVPTVRVEWGGVAVHVTERLSCPNFSEAVLLREVVVRNRTRRRLKLRIETGVRTTVLAKTLWLAAAGTKTFFLRYILDASGDRVHPELTRKTAVNREAADFWKHLSRISFGHPRLDHYFRAAKFQLPAVIARSGRLDGGIWQYNREWLRDQAMVALALTMTGAHGLARTMFTRLFDAFVTPEGDTIDSSEKRDPGEVELDQNGFLLTTFKDYVLWTGDIALARKNWPKIVAAAEFPLKAVFRHEASGLLANRREFWERHSAHGIEPGLELVHQVYTVVGLQAAAVLARMLRHPQEAVRWEREALRIRTAMLGDPVFRLADTRGFIKRRGLDGLAQEKIVARPDSGLPDEAPLAKAGDHWLNPDTCTALPIALGLIPPDSPLCRQTLGTLERLWNQAWTGGGYGRYNATSEPDSPGAWPFPSLFVARAGVEAANYDNVWRILRWLGTVPGASAGSWFEFYGRRLAPPFPQVGILPWTWAEIVVLFVHHILGIQPLETGLRVRPKPLPGLKTIEASFPFQRGRLELLIRIGPQGAKIRFDSPNVILPCSSPSEVVLAYSGRNLKVDVRA